MIGKDYEVKVVVFKMLMKHCTVEGAVAKALTG